MFSGVMGRKVTVPLFSTHHLLNRLAYTLLPKTLEKPSLEAIQHYSGHYGPDGDALRWTGKDSAHAYNPDTGEGGALKETSKHLKKASIALGKKHLEQAAYHFAYVSHFIVDALTPAHHVGWKKQVIGSHDWEDPHWDYRKFSFNPHVQFELKSALCLPWSMKRIVDRAYKMSLKPKEIAGLMKEKVSEVHDKSLLSRFIKKEDISYNLRRKLFPSMVTNITAAWGSVLDNVKNEC